MSKSIIFPKQFYPTKKQRSNAIRLAKDIITQLLFKKSIRVKTGTYCEFDFKKYDTREEKQEIVDKFNNSLKELLVKGKKSDYLCKVCALGAFFVSKVHLDDMCDIRACYNVDEIANVLGAINSNLIESSFEQIWMTNRSEFDESFPCDFFNIDTNIHIYEDLVVSSCKTFKSNNSRNRLFSICRNIIRNKGIFVPRGYTLN